MTPTFSLWDTADVVRNRRLRHSTGESCLEAGPFPDAASDYLEAVPLLLRPGPAGPGWVIVRPLLATLERDVDNWWIISDDEFLVYGDGESFEAAYKDYVTSLGEYCDLIAAGALENEHDGAELRRVHNYLRPA